MACANHVRNLIDFKSSVVDIASEEGVYISNDGLICRRWRAWG